MSATDAQAPGADQALAADELDEYQTLLRAAGKLLDGVDRALVSLDDGSYAICEVCGTALDDRDLEEDPLVTRCVQHRGPQGD